MNDAGYQRWIDILYKEEALVVSTRNWLEARFWSIFAAVSATFNWVVGATEKHFFLDGKVLEGVVLSFSLVASVVFWVFIGISVCRVSRQGRIRNLFQFRLMYVFLLVFSLGMLFLHIHAALALALLFDRWIIFFAFPVAALSMVVLIALRPLVKRDVFEEAQARHLSRGFFDTRSFIERFLFVLFVMAPVVYGYVVFCGETGRNVFLDTKYFFALFLFIYAILELIGIRIDVGSLPDLSEFKHKILCRAFSSEEDVLMMYEEVLLGRNALSWLKHKARQSKWSIEYTAKEIEKLHDAIEAFKRGESTMQKRWFKFELDYLTKTVDGEETRLVASPYIPLLNMTQEDDQRYIDFLEKNLRPLLNSNKEALLRVKKEAESVKDLL